MFSLTLPDAVLFRVVRATGGRTTCDGNLDARGVRVSLGMIRGVRVSLGIISGVRVSLGITRDAVEEIREGLGIRDR